MKKMIVVLLIGFLYCGSVVAVEVMPLLTNPLPKTLDRQETTMLTVEMEPGSSSPSHRHNAYVYVYVLEGKVGMQVEGGPLKTLGPGEIFTELPTDVHTVSKNMSDTEPAKILIFMVKEKGAALTVPAE